MIDDTSTKAPTSTNSSAARDPIFADGWAALGRRIERVAARTEPSSLSQLLREAECLIVATVWRAQGDNISHISGYLQTSRKRIRDSLDEVRTPRLPPRRAQDRGETGDAIPPSSTEARPSR